MNLNLQNFEEIILYDPEIKKLFPELRHYFDQWALGTRIPGLRTLAQRSKIELFQVLDSEHRKILEEYFGKPVYFDKLSDKLCMHTEMVLKDSENEWCQFTGFNEMTAYRNADKIYVTFWR